MQTTGTKNETNEREIYTYEIKLSEGLENDIVKGPSLTTKIFLSSSLVFTKIKYSSYKMKHHVTQGAKGLLVLSSMR